MTGHKQQKNPGELSAEQDNHNRCEDQREELLQELGQHVRHGELHTLDVVDDGGDQGPRGVLREEGCGTAQDRVIEIVTQVGDHAESGKVHQIGSGVVEESFENRGGNQGKGDDGPGILEVRGHKSLQVDGVVGARDFKELDLAALRAGVQNAIEDGSNQQDAESVEQPDDSHQQD